MPQTRPISPEADRLLALHPLPPDWSRPELFSESSAPGGHTVHLAGFTARGPGGAEAFGSAAEAGRVPFERAYFELCERVSLLAAMARTGRELQVFDGDGSRLGTCARQEAFPSAPAEAPWAFARSNGVAAGRSWREACRAAEEELLERDRILRSWYGGDAPRRIETPALGGLAPLGTLYGLEAYEFSSEEGAAVTGTFAFPKDDAHPMAYGFGAGATRAHALERASRECLQRLGFLWGEEIPAREPSPEKSAGFHQETYLCPAARPRLRAWLEGAHAGFAGKMRSPEPPSTAGTRRYVDLTPPGQTGDFRVVKALPDGEVPLVFGVGHPWADAALPAVLQIHPIP